MMMKINVTLVVAVLAVSCGDTKNHGGSGSASGGSASGGSASGGSGGGGSVGGSEPKAVSHLPAAVAAWMPATAPEAWRGAWVTHMSLSSTNKSHDYAAIDVEGKDAKGFDGTLQYPLGFSIETPCMVTFTLATTAHSLQFGIKDGKVVAGKGVVGMRKGKSALVCSNPHQMITLDDKGACKLWAIHFGKWEYDREEECAWSTANGKDMLTIGATLGQDLIADGDLLMNPQFAHEVKKGMHTRAESYEAAKQVVIDLINDLDPIARAKEAGGKVGDTRSVLGVIVTYAADPKRIEGKRIAVTGEYDSDELANTSGAVTVRITLIDGKETSKLTLLCDTKAIDREAFHFARYDRVTAKGVVKTWSDRPVLDDCTVTAAN